MQVKRLIQNVKLKCFIATVLDGEKGEVSARIPVRFVLELRRAYVTGVGYKAQELGLKAQDN
jgi:hypothetical protein